MQICALYYFIFLVHVHVDADLVIRSVRQVGEHQQFVRSFPGPYGLQVQIGIEDTSPFAIVPNAEDHVNFRTRLFPSATAVTGFLIFVW